MKLITAGCTGERRSHEHNNNRRMVDETQNNQQEATESLSPDRGADNQRFNIYFPFLLSICVDCPLKKYIIVYSVCMYTSVHFPNTNSDSVMTVLSDVVDPHLIASPNENDPKYCLKGTHNATRCD